MFSGPLSVEHMQRQTHAQKEGFWLLADLFTQPCPLSADTQSGSSSCAESSWLVLLSGRGNIRRLITLSFKSSLPDLGPSGKEKWCHWRSALKPLSLSVWSSTGDHLLMSYRIMVPQSVEIIDLFGGYKEVTVPGYHSEMRKEPMPSPWLLWSSPPFM